MSEEKVYEGIRGPGKSTAVKQAQVSEAKVRKIISKATNRARRETPRPNLLTWCLRQGLYTMYGWRPYY